VRNIARLVERGIGAPPTSSAGRLFDAVAALVNVPAARQVTYEGQAAVQLELLATDTSGVDARESYLVDLREPDGAPIVVETGGIIAAIVGDLRAGRPAGEIAAVFHRTMAEVIVQMCLRLRRAHGTPAVALSGGTFQNVLLLEQALALLEEHGFTIYRHSRVPPNDGGLALGQAILADRATRG